jgi:hypothetical protein
MTYPRLEARIGYGSGHFACLPGASLSRPVWSGDDDANAISFLASERPQFLAALASGWSYKANVGRNAAVWPPRLCTASLRPGVDVLALRAAAVTQGSGVFRECPHLS